MDQKLIDALEAAKQAIRQLNLLAKDYDTYTRLVVYEALKAVAVEVLD